MTKAVFYGDSTVEGTGASKPEKRFSSLVCRTLGWEEINLGIGDTTMTGRNDQGLVVEEDSGIGRVPDVIHAAPDIVVILYGSHDFAQSYALGDPARFQQGTFLWDYDTALRGLIENLPDTEICISTLVYRSDAHTPNALGLALEAYSDVIRYLGDRYRIRIAESYAESGINERNIAAFSIDGIHLNDDGYQRLAAYFIECLQTDRCG